VAQRNDHAHRVLDLARKEADLFGHRYLGPEHLVLGVLRDGGSEASRALEAHGVDLPAAREALGRLVDRGVVPGPRPSDAELLGSLGIDLDAIRRTTEQSFGGKAWGGRSGRRPGRDEVGLGGCRGRRCVTHRCSSARCWFTPASRPRRSALL
jgi:ClpA/ClpB-like protein